MNQAGKKTTRGQPRGRRPLCSWPAHRRPLLCLLLLFLFLLLFMTLTWLN